MKDASWYAVRNVTDKSAEVSIYDEIGLFGVTAKEFTNSLQSLGNRRLTVRIHSPGGEIFEGNAVYNALRRHKGGVDVAIDGLAASMASVIAMAGEKRSMAENAMLMIHNPWTVTYGESSDLRKSADLMDTLKEGIINAYAGRTGMDRDDLAGMMDEETWLTAEEAKKYGFITDITEGLNMQNSFQGFDISRFPKRPTNFMSELPEHKEEVTPEDKGITPEAKAKVEVVEISAEEKAIVALKAEAARVPELESKIVAYQAEVVNLGKENEALREDIKKERMTNDRLKAALQIAPANVIVEVPAEAKSIFEQYNELEGEAATAFYNKHREELLPYLTKKA